MRRAGNSSRKLPARTSSTSRHSAGEALCTDTARGRLLAAAIATIFVPLPRRVGPTARPPFSARERRIHERFFQVQLAALLQVLGQPPQRLFQLPVPHPLLESTMAGLERGILFRQ